MQVKAPLPQLLGLMEWMMTEDVKNSMMRCLGAHYEFDEIICDICGSPNECCRCTLEDIKEFLTNNQECDPPYTMVKDPLVDKYIRTRISPSELDHSRE